MKRVDCENCFHSEFEDGDKLRCRLKKCQGFNCGAGVL